MPGKRRLNGEGSYYFDEKTGYWMFRIEANGRRLTRKSRSLNECREKARDLLADIRAKTVKPTRQPTFGPYADAWYTVHRERLTSDASRKSYDRNLGYLKAVFGKKLVSAIDADEVERGALILKARHGARTAQMCQRQLGQIMKLAVRKGLVSINPCSIAERVQYEPKEPRVFSVEEITAVMANLDGNYAPVLRFLAFTGMRISQALNLKLFQVNLRRRVVTSDTAKTHASKGMQDLGADAVQAVHEAIALRNSHATEEPFEDSGRLFVTSTGGPMYARNVQRALDAALKRAGIGHYSLHDFRHSVGTHLADAGVSLSKIQAALRHKSAATTAKYYVSQKKLRTAGTIERLPWATGSTTGSEAPDDAAGGVDEMDI